jgi:hypothetical protein
MPRFLDCLAPQCTQLISMLSNHLMLLLLSLSRLNHGQPGVQAYPEVVQGTAEFHHEITDARLPQTDPVFDDATALDTAVDVLNAQPTVVQRLVGSVLLPRKLLAAGVSWSA